MTVDELLAMAPAAVGATDEMLVIDPDTRQINLPGVELIFGVESDAHSERKYFYCPRYVGNGLDLASCFIRVNYRNANGVVDAYLVDDMSYTDDAITFSWALHRNVTLYKGQVQFVVCCNRPGSPAAEWNTTVTTGIVLAGLEPDGAAVEAATSDAISGLLATVDAQVANVTAEGTAQVKVVKTASETAETAAVAEIEAKGVNVRASIPDDYTALSGAVRAIEKGMAPGIVCEVEGTAVAVSDASNQAMRGLRIFGKSTQAGTPTPTAPVEIVSVESPVVNIYGKNLCNMKAFDSMGSNGTSNSYDAETHTITLNAGAASVSGRYGSPVKVLPVGEKCTVSFDIRGTAGRIVKCGWDKKKTTITLTDTYKRYSSTMVITVKTEPISFYTELASMGGLRSGEYMQFANVQVEYGDVATEYEEYRTAQTVSMTHTLPGIPVTSDGNYTDSDGQQWISDEVDLERGVYVQRVSRLVVSPENPKTFIGSDKMVYYPMTNYGVYGTRVYCSHYENIGFNSTGASVKFDGFATVDEFNSFVSGKTVTVVYILAVPIETPLSETEIATYRVLHTNKPNTTILNDSGAHMAVAYTADTKLYIDNLLKE